MNCWSGRSIADYWALQWADLLRVDRQSLGHKRAYAYYQWIRDSLAAEQAVRPVRPRACVTAEGPLDEDGAGQLLQGRDQARARRPARWRRCSSACALPAPSAITIRSTAGARTDYYGMQAFFARRGRASRSAHGELLAVDGRRRQTRNPRTGETILAHALGEPMPAKSPSRATAAPPWPTG